MDERSNSSGPVGGLGVAGDAEPRALRAVVLGLLGAVVLAVGGLLLLAGGSSATGAALTVPPAAPAAAPAASASPLAAAPAAGASPRPTVPGSDGEERPARDPFQAPPQAEVAAASATPAGLARPDVASGAPPTTSTPAPRAPAVGTLALVRVEAVGERRSAIFTVDGAQIRTEVGSSFGPDGGLLLLSLQQEPDGAGWTAVLQIVGSEPFDVVTGEHVHLS